MTPILIYGNPQHPRRAEAELLATTRLPGDVRVAVLFDYLDTAGVSVRVDMLCYQRDTEEPQWYGSTVCYGNDPRPLDQLVRCSLMRAYGHEVDECLYADGVRVFDPHWDEVVVEAA